MIKIKDFAKVLRGKRLTKDQLSNCNKYAVYHGGLEPLGFYNEFNREADTVMIINVGASAGTVGYCKDNFWSSDGCFCISKNENVLSKYLYYFLKSKEMYFQSKVRRAGIPTLDNFIVEDFEVSLPPLDIQIKIVHVLDHFESICKDLNIGLPAEIEARKKQYEYYRDALLNFAETGNVDFAEREALYKLIQYVWGYVEVSIGSLIEKNSEKAKSDKTIETVYTVSKTYGLVSSIDYWTKTASKNRADYQMFSEDTSNYNIIRKNMFAYNPARLNIGSIDCLIDKEEGIISPMYVVFKVNENLILPKFLKLWLKSERVLIEIDNKKEEGARFRFDFNNWNKIFIKVPSLETQKRIITKLDTLDTLCNDLTQGLPAEIEARKKQYEYYRDSF